MTSGSSRIARVTTVAAVYDRRVRRSQSAATTRTPNFPECPAWFNEGLASLYEQSSTKNGRIHGKINWRYKALEQAIKDRKLISFEQLTATSDEAFYGGNNNPNYNQHYAQARYLCYYLQEQGLLINFYKQYVTGAKSDPTGVQSLKTVLGDPDLKSFQVKWEKFVLGLKVE